jgi:4-amino-4-deoxy-L-arabinose transferase-like glycosyltransferase
MAANGVYAFRGPGWFTHNRCALLLAVATVVLLTVSAPNVGLTWDEPAYIVAGESYAEWYHKLVSDPGYALSDEGIDYHWVINHEHPPLPKAWAGLVWSAARFVLDDLTAHRLGSIILAGGLVGLVYLAAAKHSGQVAGLAAAASLLTMPRFFFHSHLAALDVPTAFAMFGVVYLFWQTAGRAALKWDLILGLAFGLALASKLNAAMVPPILLFWLLVFRRRLYLFRRLFVMTVVGAPLFVALWPWLYRQPLERIAEYVRFMTVDHYAIGQWYLGAFRLPPPWHFPFLVTLAVLPLSVTILYLVGIARSAAERRSRSFGCLLIAFSFLPMLALVVGKSFLFDNERLFIPCYPYLACLAGLGFDWIVRGVRSGAERFRRPAWATVLTAAVGLAAFVPHTLIACRLYPHLLSYYSEGIGGLSCAARLGFETTYWAETYAEALPYLNSNAEPGDAVWVQDWSHDVMIYYQLHGLLRPDLAIARTPGARSYFEREGVEAHWGSIWEADHVVLQYRQTGFNEDIRLYLDEHSPVYQLAYDGVPLMEIYAAEKE